MKLKLAFLDDYDNPYWSATEWVDDKLLEKIKSYAHENGLGLERLLLHLFLPDDLEC